MTQNMPIQNLLSVDGNNNLHVILARLCELRAWRPFDERAVHFVSSFSQKLLTNKCIREFPELMALGHWFRKANLMEMANHCKHTRPGQVQVGRGLVFHLAPSNVDSIFMYSWLLSLLAGNANLIRISQKGGQQQEILIELLNKLVQAPEHHEVAERFVLITYGHDVHITQTISEACMMRVVWGGDETVRTIRSIPLRPVATELCFADRFSVAALAASAVLQANEHELKELVKGFYNDAFWFAQQACSSPRLVVWIGNDEEIQKASQKFWSELESYIQHQQAVNAPAMVMARLGAVFEYAALKLARLSEDDRLSDFPVRLNMQTPGMNSIRGIHCGNGLFLQTHISHLSELGAKLSENEQTVSAYGFQEDDFLALIEELPARALDRIVPVGSALAFNHVWDGQDLITSFTRIVSLK